MADRISNVVTPAFLQGVSLAFRNRSLIADLVAPIITVPKDRGLYRVYGKNEYMTHEARWAYGAIPNQIGWRFSSGNYFSEPRKLRIELLDAEIKNQDSDLDVRRGKTRAVTNAILLARELRVATLFTTAGNYPGANVITKAGGSEWDTVLGATPSIVKTDLDTLIRAVVAQALVPRSELTIVMPEPVFDAVVRFNSYFLTSLNYTSPNSYTPELLANFLGVKQVLLAATMTTGPGPEVAGSDIVTGFTTSYVWGDNVWVGLVNDQQTEEVPTFARSFNWKADTNGQQRLIRQYRFADEGAEADWIECKENMGEQIVFSGAGALLKNALSTI